MFKISLNVYENSTRLLDVVMERTQSNQLLCSIFNSSSLKLRFIARKLMGHSLYSVCHKNVPLHYAVYICVHTFNCTGNITHINFR